MNYTAITTSDINNGPGFRVTLWVSGCNFHCPNCHNQALWDFDKGINFTTDTLDYLISEINHNYIDGFSLLGGEPLHQNELILHDMLTKIKQKTGKSVWLYTGYTWEKIPKQYKSLFTDGLVDVVVDGLYVDALRDISLAFRGSKNQRLIDVKKTLDTGKVTTLNL